MCNSERKQGSACSFFLTLGCRRFSRSSDLRRPSGARQLRLDHRPGPVRAQRMLALHALADEVQLVVRGRGGDESAIRLPAWIGRGGEREVLHAG